MSNAGPRNDVCAVCGAAVGPGGVCVACLLLCAADEEMEQSGTMGRIGGYDLIEVIARGGMGIVYRARQHEPEREVALKALPGAELLSEEARQRFKIEAQAMARLEHPAIVPIHELGEDGGTPYFTMKLATGGCLAQKTGDYAGNWREIAALIATISEAVHYAHERGVLHRDLKPGNVLFDQSGQALVSDFGLAKIIGEGADLTRTIALMGTPNYLAPELTRGGKGAATTACDVWSLGVMLYELLAGRLPFRGDNLATILRQLNEEEPELLPREVPRDLAVIAGRALQKMPLRRYESAQALADDLRRWLAGEPIQARPVPLAERAWLWARRKPALAAALALLALTLLGSAVSLVQANRRLTRTVVRAESAEATSEANLREAWRVQARLGLQTLTPGKTKTAAGLLEKAGEGDSKVTARTDWCDVLTCPDARYAKGFPACFVPDLKGYHMAATPDLRWLACLKNESTVILRGLTSGKVRWRHRLKKGEKVLRFDLSDDGARVAFMFTDHRLEVWDTESNQCLVRTQLLDARSPWSASSRSGDLTVLFDLHGSIDQLACVEADGRVTVRKPCTAEPVVTDANGKLALGLAFNPAGDRLALNLASLAGDQDTVRLWNWQSQKLENRRGGDMRDVSPLLAWHPEGEWLAVFPVIDFEASILDATTSLEALPQFRLQHLRDDASDLGFVPKHGSVVIVEVTGRVFARHLISGQNLWERKFSPGLFQLASGGEAFVALAGDNPVLYSLPESRIYAQLQMRNMARSSHSSRLLVTGPEGAFMSATDYRTVSLWDLHSESQCDDWRLRTDRQGGPNVRAAFGADGMAMFAQAIKGDDIFQRRIERSADGSMRFGEAEKLPNTQGLTLVAAAKDNAALIVSKNENLMRLSLSDGTLSEPIIPSLRHDRSRPILSPLQRYAYQPADLKVGIFEIGTGGRMPVELIREVDGKREEFVASFSPRDDWLALTSDKRVIFVRTSDWTVAGTIENRTPALGSLNDYIAMSANGRFAAIVAKQDSLILVSLPECREILRLRPPVPVDFSALVFSPDSTRLYALGDRNHFCRWDLKELNQELTKRGLGWPEP